MGRGFSSSEVAVWLRVQMAAGRVPQSNRQGEIERLARRLGVSAQTMSQAFDLVEEGRDSTSLGNGKGGANRYRVVADLVDKIALFDKRTG